MLLATFNKRSSVGLSEGLENETSIRMTAASDKALTKLSEDLLADYEAWDAATSDLLQPFAHGFAWPQSGASSFNLDETDLKSVAVNGITSQHVWIGFEGYLNLYVSLPPSKEGAYEKLKDPTDIFSTSSNTGKKFVKSIIDWLYGLPEHATLPEGGGSPDKPLALILYKGPYFTQSLEFIVLRSRDGSLFTSPYSKGLRLRAYSRVTLAVPASESAFKGITKLLKKVPKWKNVAQIALKQWYDLGYFPPLFDLSIPISTDLSLTGVVKVGTEFYYLPPSEVMEYDQRPKIFQKIIETGRGSLPTNTFISLDAKGGKLTYTDSIGYLQEFLISSSLRVTQEDIVGVLKRSVYEILVSTQKGSLSEIYNFWAFAGGAIPNLDKIKDSLLADSSIAVGEFQDKPRLKEFLTSLKTYMEGRFNQLSPITWFHFMGLIRLIYDNIDKYKDLKNKVEEKRKAFDEATSSDVPSLPYLDEDFAYFPHQAQALAKMDKAEETAILDVGTGGGKTLLQISDALNLMAKGKVKRPLNIMPNALCGQFAGEVISFTGGELNAFVLNTDTKNSWGEDYLWSAAASAPINTYFITSYEFLVAGAEEYEWGTRFPNVDKIKELLDPDWISVDESHNFKNSSSKRHQAVMQLNTAPYRRIATGTLITNKPTDLPGQVEFLDPMAVGDMPEFLARYYRGSTPKSNAADLIREDLKLRSFYLVYREKDWAAFLPKPIFTDYFVDMTEGQTKIYKSIVQQVMEEIRNDPELSRAWQKLIEMGEDSDLDYLPTTILPKMMRLEMYLTAPDVSEFGAKVLSPADLISPKIAKIDELIGQSLKGDGKVIVAVHYKHSARHLYNHSKHKAVSLYYDALVKQNLLEFKTNPNVRVLFAVSASLTEGQNLQIADRIIVADVDWTPGKLKQLMARIYRPSIKKDESGKYINANAGKTIYIDTVLVQHSADCVKWSFQMRKKIFNAQIMENCNVPLPPPPGFSEDALTASFDSPLIKGPEVKARGDEYNAWFIDLVETAKRETPEVEFIKPPTGKPLKNSAKIDVPWVRGMLVTVDASTRITLAEWMENERLSTDDLREHKKRLIGLAIQTDSGLGSISGVSKYSVQVKLEEGYVYSVTPYTCYVVVNPKVNSKKAGKEKKVDALAPSVKKEKREKLRVTPEGIDYDEPGVFDITEEVKDAERRKKLKVEPGITESLEEDKDEWDIEEEEDGKREYSPEEDKRATQRPAEKLPLSKEKKISVDKKKKSQKVAEEEGAQGKDNVVSLEFVLINGMPSIVAWPEDPDTADFPDFGFRWSRPIWEYQIKSRPQANAILDRLEDKFNIPEDLLEECREVIRRSAKGRYSGQPVSAGELKNFYRLTLFRKAKAGMLKLYPLVWMGTPYLILDMKSHPGVQLGRYKFYKSTDPFLYKICRNKMELKQALTSIVKSGLTIDNLDEFKTQAKRSSFKI